MSATDDPPLGRCATHDVDTRRACARCGRFYCDACAGSAPNDGHCVECDRRIGVIPWERELETHGPIRTWWATVRAVVRRPRDLQRLSADGTSALALTFAVRSTVVYFVVQFVIASTLVRYDVHHSFPGSLTIVGVHTLGVLAVPLAIVTSAPLYFALARLAGSPVSLANAMRVFSYATAYAPFAAVPALGLVPVVLAARALAIALPGPISSLRRGLVAGGLFFAWACALYGIGALSWLDSRASRG